MCEERIDERAWHGSQGRATGFRLIDQGFCEIFQRGTQLTVKYHKPFGWPPKRLSLRDKQVWRAGWREGWAIEHDGIEPPGGRDSCMDYVFAEGQAQGRRDASDYRAILLALQVRAKQLPQFREPSPDPHLLDPRRLP